jgi:hypothetical protein
MRSIYKKTFYLVVFIAVTMFLACSCQSQEYNSEQNYNSREDFEIEDYKSLNMVAITKYTGTSRNVNIPPYIKNVRVGIIGNRAFYDKKLTSVTLPKSVESIYAYAFAENQLTSVTIPDTDYVYNISKFAFSSNQIVNINIGEKVKVDPLAFDNEFAGFYLRNGSKAGKYTYKNGKWKVKFIKKPTTDPVIDGVYKITATYSHLYNHVFSGDAFREIETEKLGLLVTINNYKATFEDIEYEIHEGNGYSSRTKDNLLEYEDFRRMSEGMNYGWFDENIIGKEYTGKVKAMTMLNNENSYYIFFADNKLIIMIDTKKHETEFERLIRVKGLDTFFYIAEKNVK